MLLVRGNYWTHGISGFGHNRFSALTGEYRLDGVSGEAAANKNGGANTFFVYLTREPLYFSEEWQTGRRGMTDIEIFQREGEEGFLAAVPLDDGRGASWVAVFRFPFGLEAAGLNDNDFNHILRIWIRRFSYFLSLAKTPGELSLPAAVEF
jgi:hypothetical protein